MVIEGSQIISVVFYVVHTPLDPIEPGCGNSLPRAEPRGIMSGMAYLGCMAKAAASTLDALQGQNQRVTCRFRLSGRFSRLLIGCHCLVYQVGN